MRLMRLMRHTLLVGLAASLALAPAAFAQPLTPKRTLPLPAAGCLGVAAPASAARRDNAEARRLAAQGREAALVGDHAAARDALRRATALNPGDEQLLYALGRSDEELADSAAAIGDYCRFIALSPGGAQADDVRQRILRLAPPTAADATRRARETFQAGLAALDAGRHADAVAAFDRVLRDVPNAPEALFDRALARAALNRRDEAARDLEAYLSAAQAAEDRALVLRALDGLRRPVYSPSLAFQRGLLAPGLGQLHTGRPALGAVALGAVLASVAGALYERDVVRERTFTDPFGNPYTQSVSERERPYVGPAIAAGLAVWALAAIEARHYASSSSGRHMQVAPYSARRGTAGLRLRASF